MAAARQGDQEQDEEEITASPARGGRRGPAPPRFHTENMSARSDFISGLVVLAITLVFYLETQRIEEDPFSVGMQPIVFPETICRMIGAIALIMVVNAARKLQRVDFQQSDGSELRLFVVWVLPMAAIVFAYIGLMDLFQYLIPTALALSATLVLFGNRGIKWYLTIPAISSVVYYVVFFGIFRLLEPTGRLLEYDNNYIFGPMRGVLGI
jgi:hypothetical protein